MMKAILRVLFVVSVLFASIVFAQEKQKKSGMIDAVYNDRGLIVVNDAVYKMALNLSVLDKSRAKKLNRYGLKQGQRIVFAASARTPDKVPVINDIVILKK